MEKLIKTMFAVLLAATMSLMLGACGDDDEPKPDDGPENVNPDTPTDDPVGTISLAMRNKANGGTLLDGIGIGEDNNFYCSEKYHDRRITFCDLGPVAGLGNVSAIPTTGWAQKVKVIPGHGYIAVREDQTWDSYGFYWKVVRIYRIFVVDYIGNEMGGIMGVNIKYQTPFEGADTALTLDKDAVVISEETPSAEVAVTNKTYIPFEISVDGPFNVSRVYGSNTEFITMGLVITNTDEPFPTEAASGKIKLTTASGKVTEITVTRQGADPYITLQESEVEFNCRGLKDSKIAFSTNITDEISATSSAGWIKASVLPGRNDGWAEREVSIVTSTNCTADTRIGYVTVKYGTVSKTIKVIQTGFLSVPHIDDIVETGPESGWRNDIYAYQGNPTSPYIDFRDVYIEKENGKDWITYISKNYRGVELCLDANNTGASREGMIYVYYPQNGLFDDILVASFTIRQLAE